MLRPLLYTYRRCPYAMRARMALISAGVAFDALELSSLREKPAAMLAASPKGTVPVMVLPSGQVLEESLQIMHWAFAQHDPQAIWDRAQTPENQALIALNDGAFKQQLDRYKYPNRFEAVNPQAQRDQAVSGLILQLEQRLSQEAYLGGGSPCAADLAIFPFMRQFRATDAAWFDTQSFVATQQWLQAWLKSPLFDICIRKLPTAERVMFNLDVHILQTTGPISNGQTFAALD